MKKETNERRARKKWLEPLAQMPYSQCVMTLSEMKPRQANATLRAMQTATRTNCGWAEYDLAQRFASMLERKLSAHECGHKRLVELRFTATRR